MAQISAALRQPCAGSGGCANEAPFTGGAKARSSAQSSRRPIKRTLTDQFGRLNALKVQLPTGTTR